MDQRKPQPAMIVFFLLQIILYAAASRTVQLKETDFPAFYSAARTWTSGRNPYSLEEQCRLQIPIRGEPCLPFAHPPVLLPLMSLVSGESFDSSYYRWTLLLLVVTAVCIFPLYQISRDWEASFQSLLFPPVVVAITLGQDTPFILLAVLSWAWLLNIQKDFLAGLALSLAVVKPQIALLLALPLLFSRPRAFAGFCIGAVALMAYSFVLVGLQGFRGLLGIVHLMSQGDGFGVNPKAMINATALLLRAGLSANWVWVTFALGLIVTSLIWKRMGTSPNQLVPGIVVALFCAPHLHMHDLSLLSLSLVLVPPATAMLCSALLLFAYAFGWQQWAGYALMLGLLITHLIPGRQFKPNKHPG